MGLAEKIKVMVVDDQVTSRALQSLCFKNISVAKDGEDAFGMLVREPHHLIISDFNMPRMDGLSLLQVVRQGGRKGLCRRDDLAHPCTWIGKDQEGLVMGLRT